MPQTTFDAEPKAHAKKDTGSIKAKEQEFIKSCRPLKEMIDSVRDIEGFPIGKDEDILALSDAPWYTACPNPYVNEFIKAFGTPYDEDTDDYERKPFVSDVSEGKNDPIYNAHSYHTKVPHKAIAFIPCLIKPIVPGIAIFAIICVASVYWVPLAKPASSICFNIMLNNSFHLSSPSRSLKSPNAL